MGPVSPLTRRTAAVLAWAVATVLAGTVAWAAVGALGRGPGGAEGAVLSQGDVASALLAQRAAIAAASASPTATPTASPTPTPTPTVSPTTEPPPTTTPVPPTEIARIWPVNGGQVSASCSGSTITLLGATPADGWGVETKNAGPAELEVEFDRDGSETRVLASCVNGTPQMEVGGTSDEDRSGDD